MESLTPSGWSSTMSIEEVFMEILSTILQGEARLDKDRLGNSYSFEEARREFGWKAQHFGWI